MTRSPSSATNSTSSLAIHRTEGFDSCTLTMCTTFFLTFDSNFRKCTERRSRNIGTVPFVDKLYLRSAYPRSARERNELGLSLTFPSRSQYPVTHPQVFYKSSTFPSHLLIRYSFNVYCPRPKVRILSLRPKKSERCFSKAFNDSLCSSLNRILD